MYSNENFSISSPPTTITNSHDKSDWNDEQNYGQHKHEPGEVVNTVGVEGLEHKGGQEIGDPLPTVHQSKQRPCRMQTKQH